MYSMGVRYRARRASRSMADPYPLEINPSAPARQREPSRKDPSGVKTTIPFHQRVLADERFRSGDVSTDFVEQFMAKAPAAA